MGRAILSHLAAKLAFGAAVAVVALPASAQTARSRTRSGAEARASAEKAAEEEKPTPEEVERYRKAVRVIERSKDVPVLVRAAAKLREAFPRSRSVLLEATRHSASQVRVYALKIFGERGDVGRDLNVVAPALGDPESAVRLAAVMALQRLGKEGFPALAAYLPGEPKPNNRKMAVKTLERWRDQNAIPILVRLLRTEKHDGVRSFIVTALERLSNRELGDDLEAWEDYLKGFVPPEQKRLQQDKLLELLESRRSERTTER